jgi:TRAP-type transport system periplasmic protein
VAHLTTAQKDAFRQATRPVFEKWTKTVGEGLVAKAEAEIAKR